MSPATRTATTAAAVITADVSSNSQVSPLRSPPQTQTQPLSPPPRSTSAADIPRPSTLARIRRRYDEIIDAVRTRDPSAVAELSQLVAETDRIFESPMLPAEMEMSVEDLLDDMRIVAGAIADMKAPLRTSSDLAALRRETEEKQAADDDALRRRHQILTSAEKKRAIDAAAARKAAAKKSPPARLTKPTSVIGMKRGRVLPLSPPQTVKSSAPRLKADAPTTKVVAAKSTRFVPSADHSPTIPIAIPTPTAILATPVRARRSTRNQVSLFNTAVTPPSSASEYSPIETATDNVTAAANRVRSKRRVNIDEQNRKKQKSREPIDDDEQDRRDRANEFDPYEMTSNMYFT